MNCQIYTNMKLEHIKTDDFWLLLSDELTESQKQPLFNHISVCPECQKEYQTRIILNETLESLDFLLPSMDLSNKIVERLEKEKKLDRSIQFWKNMTVQCLFAGLILISGLFLIKFIIEPPNIVFAFEKINFGPAYQFILWTAILSWLFFLIDHFLKRRIIRSS